MRSKITEEAIIRLIQKERFFANLIMQFNRIYVGDDHPVKTAAVSITDKINLYVYEPFFANPFEMKLPEGEELAKIKEQLGKDFDKWHEGMLDRISKLKKVDNPTIEQIHKAQEVILIHECMHIMNNHIPRSKGMNTKIGDGKYSFTHQAMNIAMDCAINQLHNVEETVDLFGGITLKSFREMCEDNSIEANQTFEYYFNKMKQNADKLTQKYGENLEGASTQDDHGQWEEGETGEEYSRELVKEACRKAARETGAGNIPGDVQLLLDRLFESKVNWKQELRRFMQGFVKFTKKPTRSKRNRKYGILQAGKKKKYFAHLAVAVDTSGSMSDEDLRRCFTEIHKIATTTNIQLTVIEADSEVTQIYPYDPKKTPAIKGRGGTAYQPAFDKAEELQVNGVIYLGDMDAFDTPKRPSMPVLWGVIGSTQKPPGDFGKAIYIDTQSGEFAKSA